MRSPLKTYSHYSIQQSFNHIDDLCKRAIKLQYQCLTLTDKHSLSGCPEFIRNCKKNKIKPIIGCDFNTNNGESVTLYAKNKNGWYSLIKILSQSKIGKDQQEYVTVEDICKNSKDLICLISKEIQPNKNLCDTLSKFFHDLIYEEDADHPVYYTEKEDLLYQKIIICSKHKTTLSEAEVDIGDRIFFDSDPEFFLKEPDKYRDIKLFDEVETFDIAQPPIIPSLPGINDPDEFLRQLCREGWVNKNMNSRVGKELRSVYADRINEELSLFKEFKLSHYMLVIWDIMKYATDNGIPVGLRGSAAGCLVAFLIGLSDVDPVMPDPNLPYHPDRCLLFSRFINRGRLSEGHVSLPDCDCDIAIGFRENLIDYINQKYGENKVASIITFLRMDGKGAIKEVFRILGQSFDIANEINKYMLPSEKIQDVLADIQEEEPNYGIINYCIDNVPEISNYYKEYTKEFDIAIKIAKTIRSTGKHAAGIVITNSNLSESFPTKIDSKTHKKLLAFEMADAEYCGAVKYDFLGVAALEKIYIIEKMIDENLSMPIVN